MSSTAQPPQNRPQRTRRSGFRALRQPAFRIYFGGMLIRGSALWTLFVTIPWYLVSTGATAGDVGLVVALQFLSVFVIAPFGGVIGDRINRAVVLFVTQALSAVLSAGFVVIVVQEITALPVIGAGAFLLGTLIAAELPIRQAYVTELVPSEDITSAVSLHAVAWNTTRFVGPGIAGLVIAGPGIAAAFALAGIGAAVVAASTIVMERLRPPRPPREPSREGVLRSLVAGFRYVGTEPRILWALVFVTSTGIFGIMGFQTLIPLYARDLLNLEAAGYGGLVALWGLGAVVSTYVVTAFARGPRWTWMIGGLATFAVLFAALSLVSFAPLAYVLAFGIGLGQTAVVQNGLVTVQRATSDAMRGRVMGVYVMVFQGSNPIGAAFAGIMGELFGVQTAMLAAGVMLFLVAIAGFVGSRGLRSAGSTPPVEPTATERPR